MPGLRVRPQGETRRKLATDDTSVSMLALSKMRALFYVDVGAHPAEPELEPLCPGRFAACGDVGRGKLDIIEADDSLTELVRCYGDAPVLRLDDLR